MTILDDIADRVHDAMIDALFTSEEDPTPDAATRWANRLQDAVIEAINTYNERYSND